MIDWANLSRTERRAILRLVRDDQERIGVQLETIERGLYPAILALHDKGLLISKLGWRDSVWVLLTGKAHSLRSDAGRPV